MPNVTVTPPAVIKVQVGTPSNPTVPVINYGGAGIQKFRQLIDVDATNLVDGYGVVYVSATDKFTVEPIVLQNIDNGFF